LLAGFAVACVWAHHPVMARTVRRDPRPEVQWSDRAGIALGVVWVGLFSITCLLAFLP